MHHELAARHVLIGFDGRVKLIGFGGRLIADYQNEKRGGLVILPFDSMAPEQLTGKEGEAVHQFPSEPRRSP